jgi:hypothetical protein
LTVICNLSSEGGFRAAGWTGSETAGAGDRGVSVPRRPECACRMPLWEGWEDPARRRLTQAAGIRGIQAAVEAGLRAEFDQRLAKRRGGRSRPAGKGGRQEGRQAEREAQAGRPVAAANERAHARGLS